MDVKLELIERPSRELRKGCRELNDAMLVGSIGREGALIIILDPQSLYFPVARLDTSVRKNEIVLLLASGFELHLSMEGFYVTASYARKAQLPECRLELSGVKLLSVSLSFTGWAYSMNGRPSHQTIDKAHKLARNFDEVFLRACNIKFVG